MNQANQTYLFRTANRIVAGRHSLGRVGEHLPMSGTFRSALIFTGSSMVRLGYIDELKQALDRRGIFAEVTTGIDNEPTVDHLEEWNRKISGGGFDLFIGVGGGSILDAVKILSVLQTNGKSIREMIGTNLVEKPGIPTVLVPTTSGTGSEVTPNAIVTFPEEELKLAVVSDYLLPLLTVIDPVLTLSLPRQITAATGMDAFTHSFESYISNKANPFSNLFAIESMKLIARSIVRSYEDGASLDAREDMLLGSMYGGLALTASGTAAVHALAYPLGGKFHIAHGVANAMLLPHVTRVNMDSIFHRMPEIAAAIGLNTSSLSAERAAELVMEQIFAWTQTLSIPQNLAEYGVGEKDLDGLTEAALKVKRLLDNNPKVLGFEDIKGIYRKLL
ncbi:iron-containing alcohol dehydrogenase [Ferviditalea candida]|uniref:Iron-containing alcohol dehydrogenase n=1 Tax=Ferviditalea candida TaxID=3108399 RepID=A0ABU5ZEH8_9BACL|nr:iron-containing alcohol dehydrogenase [Paenibacillaceae bacterium T2]